MYLLMGTRSWWCIEMVVLVVMYRWWWSTGKKSSCSLEEAASNQTWCLHEELHIICFYLLQKAMIIFQILLERYIGPTGQRLINSEKSWMIVAEWSSGARDSLKSVTKWLQVMRCRITCPRDSHPSEHPMHQNVKEIFPTGNARYRLTTRASNLKVLRVPGE